MRNHRQTSRPLTPTHIKNAGGIWLDEEVAVDHGIVASLKPADIPAFNTNVIEEICEGIRQR